MSRKPVEELPTYEPCADFVLIQRDPPKEMSAGGIALPNPSQNKRHGRGTVVAVGPGAYTSKGILIPPQLQEGDRVIFSERAPVTVHKEGRLVLVQERDVFARFDGEPEGRVDIA